MSPSVQKVNPFNQFLPGYPEVLESDANAFLKEIKLNLKKCLENNDVKVGAKRWLSNLQKFIVLYGHRYSKEDHVYFIKVTYRMLILKNMDSYSLEGIAQILSLLLKKKYLLKRTDLQLDWRPLFDLYYYFEDSSAATRTLVKPNGSFKTHLKVAIKYSRTYFPENATQEMLNEWAPMLCPSDRSMAIAVKYMNLFLPSTSDIDPKFTYNLWLDDMMTYWNAFSNSPSWEPDFLSLLSRLVYHNVGRINWKPHIEIIFSRIMNSFCLPVTYGNSGLKLKFGLVGMCTPNVVARWIVYTMEGGRGLIQSYLSKMFLALESYFQPANSNSASEILHTFIASLCSMFIERIHLERHNKKWTSKTPVDKRLLDSDIAAFVMSIKPIAFHILYSPYEEEKKTVFNILSTLEPVLIIPDLLDRLRDANDSLTEPHKFSACIHALCASSRPFVENYPEEVVDILMLLLPGIDVNDVWKFAENFIFMSDLFDAIWVVDFSNPANRCKDLDLTEKEQTVLAKTSLFESFVLEFMDRCFTLIQNSRREQTRHETDILDETLNDEELAVDAAINETFHKIVVKASPEIFRVAFEKLKRFVQSWIFEVSVSGSILAGMCKSMVTAHPESTLDFFIPYLCQKIESVLLDRVDTKRADVDLQYATLLLSEVVSVKSVTCLSNSASCLHKYLDKIMGVLDKILKLDSKDEYEHATNILNNVLNNFSQIRPWQKSRTFTYAVYDSSIFSWGVSADLEKLELNWFIPSQEEFDAIQRLLDKYLLSAKVELEQFMKGEIELEKEDVLRNLRQIYKVIHGCSEVLEAIDADNEEYGGRSCLSRNLGNLSKRNITLQGKKVRTAIWELMDQVQTFLLKSRPDDTDSLTTVVMIYDTLVRHFGIDEDDLYDQIDEYRSSKLHKENKLVRSKKHLESLLVDRIRIQNSTQIWLKNIIDIGSFPIPILYKVCELSLNHYSDVRIVAQDLLARILLRITPHGHELLLPKIIPHLQDDSEVSHQMFKGALCIICMDKFYFMYNWKIIKSLAPALIKAQHSDKESVVEILKDITNKINRTSGEFIAFTIPPVEPVVDDRILSLISCDSDVSMSENNCSEQQPNQHFLELEQNLLELINSKSLHWRHEKMALGLFLYIITDGYIPKPETAETWLQMLLHDDPHVRLGAVQVVETILKLSQPAKKRYLLPEAMPRPIPIKPGVREHNEWLQYKEMDEKEFRDYWEKPFNIKSWLGFCGYPEKVSLRVCETNFTPKDPVSQKIRDYFFDPKFVEKYIEIHSIELQKDEDFFSMDKALMYSSIFERFGPELVPIWFKSIQRLAVSSEESEQRSAAELVHGVIRGSRFWDYVSAKSLWLQLTPVLNQVLHSVTNETVGDWETCLSGASNKHDPNRLRPLFELFLNDPTKLSSLQGAFKESSFLRLLNKSIVQNYKLKNLYKSAFELLKNNLDHPYQKVRKEVSSLLAALMAYDVKYGNDWHMGQGFPTIKELIDEIIPNLSLNMHNPEINGLSDPPEDQMDVDSDSQASDEGSQSNRMLQTVSLFVIYYLHSTAASLSVDVYKLLPYFCQFVGTEQHKDASQLCLKALCYLSVSLVPPKIIPEVFEIISKLQSSLSWKTKLSMLEFVQVFVFTNFMHMCHNKIFVEKAKAIVLNMLADGELQVRQKASNVLGGLIHSHFIDVEEQVVLVRNFRAKIRTKMSRTKKSSAKDKQKFTKVNIAENKAKLAEYHSGVLGLCSLIEAYPYDVPKFVPDILIELETHLHDPQPIPKTIKKCFQEFKRTHQDKWEEHKLKFTEDQLVIMTDLLISPNYYA